MQRSLLVIALLVLAAGAAPCQYAESESEIMSRCPTLSRLSGSGQLSQIRDPVFTNQAEARKFAAQCRKVAAELESAGLLTSDYQDVEQSAALAGEFLTGETYLLATSKVPSVVTLRQTVKIPPPPGFVYVKKYASVSKMPQVVKAAFESLAPSEGGKVQGITIKGRYIALLEANYQGQLADTLAHEMVHAYITLASPQELPKWFQEGAAVYFSVGSETQYYVKPGDSRIGVATAPEDYQRRLHSFQFIESRIGKEKFHQYVRRSVMTGKVDTRAALGLGAKTKPPTPATWPVPVIAAVLLLICLIIGLIQYRRETSAY